MNFSTFICDSKPLNSFDLKLYITTLIVCLFSVPLRFTTKCIISICSLIFEFVACATVR